MILINDILQLSPQEISNTKIKLNSVEPNGTDPLDLYLDEPNEVNTNWLLWHKQNRYFSLGQYAMCLLSLGNDRWLLTTIKEITKILDTNDGIGYEAIEIQKYQKFYGRLILHHHRTGPYTSKMYANIQNNLEVTEILPDNYKGDEFPGYENIRLSWFELKRIISKKGSSSWHAALQNQKAVYLITDKSNGKLYVGSATSQKGMLFDRWSNYVSSGHGGNTELRALDFDHIKNNFQYSILENFNSRTDDNYIIKREQWWKETLCSRTFGYNAN